MSEDIRVGDRFLVECEVTSVGDSIYVNCRNGGDGLSGSVRRSVLLGSKRLPRAIKVGDKVRYLGASSAPPGVDTVIAIHGDRAWLIRDDFHYIGKVANLILADEGAS